MTEEISELDCKNLALKIKNDIFKPATINKTTIFLCGASRIEKDKLRFKIAEELKKSFFYYRYDIIYPEDIFEELLCGSKSKDLLSLENLLADSVDAIVLIPESPGSFAELGAFANDNKLLQKIICIIDKKRKKDKTFIMQGPVKLIKKANKNGLLFIDPRNIQNAINKLQTMLQKLKKTSSKLKDKISLLQLGNYLLPSIYLLEPVPFETLEKIVSYATEDESNASQAARTALTILTKNRQAESTPDGYKLTQLGIKYFFSLRQTKKRVKTQKETIILDELRLEILNLKLRKKKLRV